MKELIRQKIIDSLAAPVPVLTRRDITLPALKGKSLAVVGMRRSGKTYFLWQELGRRLGQGRPRQSLLFFSFEDERLAGMVASELHLVVEEYFRLHPEIREGFGPTFFFDEIQNVPGWERFVRRLMETERAEVLISGSSAKLLSREVATSMRGRSLEVLVHPFSFREYLRHLGREPDTAPSRLPKAGRSALERDLRQYLAQGGFPETVGADLRDRVSLLQSYVDACLFRDIVERYQISHPAALRWLVRQLLGNPAGLFSVNRFYRDLVSQGMSVSKDTLHEYLSHLEDAFLVRTVWMESGSERKRMVNPRKAYPIDPGLIPLYDRSGRPNTGHALETAVMLELERRGAVVTYVKTESGYEVDFLARHPGGKVELIQVCADVADGAVLEREVRALQEAHRIHPRAAMTLVSLDPDPPKELPRGVRWLPASQWLLEG